MTTELVTSATEDESLTRRAATIEEFWALPESHLHIEYIDGEIIVAPTPTFSHQRAVLNIAMALRTYVEESKTAGEVCVSPLDVALPSGDVTQPDVFFLPPEAVARASAENRVRGVPALAVEVLSPGSIRHDRQKKRRVYEKNDVREYWIVDLKARFLTQLVLVGGRYEAKELAEDDVVRSAVLEGFETKVGELLGVG
ncbi:MAG TPA: Uma2 family endonuclease [Pyrinomonadaceae bacterium]|nr:Uma2 family endonuclease [Pyrinomonadaceae bacterium]